MYQFNLPRLFRLRVVLLVLFCLGLSGCSNQPDWQRHNPASTASISHQAWQEILEEYVIDDDDSGIHLVDYESIADEALEQLDSYLTAMAEVEISRYNRDQQFAYWVNLYNAITVQVVVKNYPVASIKDISSGLLPLGPWDDALIEIEGHEVTLNDIEHQILRPIWQDYRIHFAVNCASISCPNLPTQAFTADNTETLLNSYADQYLQHARAFEIDDDTLWLSSIFDWYQADFGTNEQTMLATLSAHLPSEKKAQLEKFKGNIDYRYDWSINSAN